MDIATQTFIILPVKTLCLLLFNLFSRIVFGIIVANSNLALANSPEIPEIDEYVSYSRQIARSIRTNYPSEEFHILNFSRAGSIIAEILERELGEDYITHSPVEQIKSLKHLTPSEQLKVLSHIFPSAHRMEGKELLIFRPIWAGLSMDEILPMLDTYAKAFYGKLPKYYFVVQNELDFSRVFDQHYYNLGKLIMENRLEIREHGPFSILVADALDREFISPIRRVLDYSSRHYATIEQLESPAFRWQSGLGFDKIDGLLPSDNPCLNRLKAIL